MAAMEAVCAGLVADNTPHHKCQAAKPQSDAGSRSPSGPQQVAGLAGGHSSATVKRTHSEPDLTKQFPTAVRKTFVNHDISASAAVAALAIERRSILSHEEESGLKYEMKDLRTRSETDLVKQFSPAAPKPSDNFSAVVATQVPESSSKLVIEGVKLKMAYETQDLRTGSENDLAKRISTAASQPSDDASVSAAVTIHALQTSSKLSCEPKVTEGLRTYSGTFFPAKQPFSRPGEYRVITACYESKQAKLLQIAPPEPFNCGSVTTSTVVAALAHESSSRPSLEEDEQVQECETKTSAGELSERNTSKGGQDKNVDTSQDDGSQEKDTLENLEEDEDRVGKDEKSDKLESIGEGGMSVLQKTYVRDDARSPKIGSKKREFQTEVYDPQGCKKMKEADKGFLKQETAQRNRIFAHKIGPKDFRHLEHIQQAVIAKVHHQSPILFMNKNGFDLYLFDGHEFKIRAFYVFSKVKEGKRVNRKKEFEGFSGQCVLLNGLICRKPHFGSKQPFDLEITPNTSAELVKDGYPLPTPTTPLSQRKHATVRGWISEWDPKETVPYMECPQKNCMKKVQHWEGDMSICPKCDSTSKQRQLLHAVRAKIVVVEEKTGKKVNLTLFKETVTKLTGLESQFFHSVADPMDGAEKLLGCLPGVDEVLDFTYVNHTGVVCGVVRDGENASLVACQHVLNLLK